MIKVHKFMENYGYRITNVARLLGVKSPPTTYKNWKQHILQDIGRNDCTATTRSVDELTEAKARDCPGDVF